MSLKIAEQYVNAFGRLAQKGNTVLLPANVSDPAAMVTQALAVFDSIRKGQQVRRDGDDTNNSAGVEVEAEDGGSGHFTGADAAGAESRSEAAASDDAARFVPKPWDTDGPKGL